MQSKSRNQLPNNKSTHHNESNKVQKRYSISPELDNEEPIIKKPCIVNHNNGNIHVECPILSDEENSAKNLDTRTSFFFVNSSNQTQSTRNNTRNTNRRKKGLSIVTCNIEGVKNNIVYFQNICANSYFMHTGTLALRNPKS